MKCGRKVHLWQTKNVIRAIIDAVIITVHLKPLKNRTEESLDIDINFRAIGSPTQLFTRPRHYVSPISSDEDSTSGWMNNTRQSKQKTCKAEYRVEVHSDGSRTEGGRKILRSSSRKRIKTSGGSSQEQ